MLRSAVYLRLRRSLQYFALGLLAIGLANGQVQSATDLAGILFPNQDDLALLQEGHSSPQSEDLVPLQHVLFPNLGDLTLRNDNHSLPPGQDIVSLQTVLFPNLGDLAVVRENHSLARANDFATLQHVAKSKSAKFPSKYDVTKIGDRGIEKGINFYSFEREQALGKELSQELEATSKLLDDPIVCDYVNKLGQRLVSYSDAKVPFTIKVLDDDQVNAFALPGGYFYVNTGLILAAESEAELAGVMAHEIAHVAARHATKGATRSQIWNLASMSLVFVGGPVGMAVRQVTSIAVPMTFMKFSRNFEREADLLGIEYEYAAGYDPQAFVDFFERIASQRKNPNFVARAFDSHPMNQDRIRRAQKEIGTMLPAHDQYLVNTSEFDEVKAHLLQRFNARLSLNAEPYTDKPVLHRRENDRAPAADTDDRPQLQRRGVPDSQPAEPKPAPEDEPSADSEDRPKLRQRSNPGSQPPEPKPEPDPFFQR
jgi:beta-barrel assembly-enhancing protease